MLNFLSTKLRRFCSRLRRPKAIYHNQSQSEPSSNGYNDDDDDHVKKYPVHKAHGNESVAIYPNGETIEGGGCGRINTIHNSSLSRPIRVATFNAALFSMAPAVSQSTIPNNDSDNNEEEIGEICRRRSSIVSRTASKSSSVHDPPKGILKQSSSPLRCTSVNSNSDSNKQREKFAKSRLRVSINLPDNEISLGRSRRLEDLEMNEKEGEGLESNGTTTTTTNTSNNNNNNKVIQEGKRMKNSAGGLRSISNNYYKDSGFDDDEDNDNNNNNNNGGGRGIMSNNNTPRNNYYKQERTVLDVLKELDADVIALQDVKAEEEKAMKPLSDLASGLGMFYVFAESWAPEYGNALLSKWPIKHCHVEKIFNDADFRNVLKATVDVPEVGDVNLYCTLLDHLDEEWRMKQVNAIIQSNHDRGDRAPPHILLGGLNSLDQTDYSVERWTDIIKYYEDIGKPTPKAEVLSFLKTTRKYIDAKDFAGECESVVMIAKGQSVQGTCKYGTRVDYIMASPGSPYKFIPGSYSVLSSKGTSDHHIVKVDLVKVESIRDIATKKMRQTHNNYYHRPPPNNHQPKNNKNTAPLIIM